MFLDNYAEAIAMARALANASHVIPLKPTSTVLGMLSGSVSFDSGRNVACGPQRQFRSRLHLHVWGCALSGGAIAVVGAACRFPGANNLEEFWDLLCSCRDAVTEIPAERWSKSYYFHPEPGRPGKSYTWAAGVIDNIDRFDAAFFGVSPREARQMDPQQRLVLETVWEAIEDAGIRAAKLASSDTGVYVGVSSVDYATLRLGDTASADAYFMTGMTNSIVANRVSYLFDLRGPSFAVDTACSSSLVALDLACNALQQGRVPVAIVGGVNLLLAPFSFVGFCQASMLSPTGRCHAFDARADGYVRAEGAGVVILKRLSDALADGDPIRAVILGSGVNSDGHTMGMSLPSEASQSALLAQVYSNTNIAPDCLAFVEAHGTGTQAGDPIELSALGNTLARKRSMPLLVGSAKTNIGHLETASGMAGLIKTILALQHRELPASLHFQTPNANIPFTELNIAVATEKKALKEAEVIAGVNSFGFGGTNAHAIIASAPMRARQVAAQSEGLPPLLLSARSTAALTALARAWSERLAGRSEESAAGLLRAAATRRDHHRHRLFCAGTDPADLARTLGEVATGSQTTSAISGLAASSGRIVFVFAGNGSQYLGMARDALRYSRHFRDGLHMADRAMAPLLGWSIETRLKEDNPEYLRRTDIAQPLLFGIQVGIVMTLRGMGIDAEACLGHSVGEIAAAWAAGALSLDAAARVVVARSHQQHRTFGEGGMAALSLDPEAAAAEIAKYGGLEIAAINSRGNVTVAGGRTSLRELQTVAEKEGWHYTPLDVEYAFHSAILDGIRDDLLAELGEVPALACGNRFISAVTGGVIPGTEVKAEYWWRNIREPVQFRDAVAKLVAAGVRIFLEIGPNPILQSYLRDGFRGADIDGRVLSTLARTQADSDPFVRIAAQCYTAGYDLAAHSDFAGPVDVAGLPRYPWQRERYWYQPTTEGIPLSAPYNEHPLLGYRWQSDTSEWTQVLDTGRLPWLADHAVDGIAVLPAAATLEIALSVARTRQPGAATLNLDEVEIRQAVAMANDRPQQLRVRLDGERAIVIDSRPRLSDENHLLHAIARIAPQAHTKPPLLASAGLGTRLDAATVYARAQALGLDYGPAFRVVSHVDILDGDTAHAWLVPSNHAAATAGYLLAPPLLDGGLQAFLALFGHGEADRPGFSLLPWRFASVRLFAPFGRLPNQARLVVKHRGTRSVCGAITYYDDAGQAVADIAECWFRGVRLTKRETDVERTFHWALAAAPRPADDVPHAVHPEEIIRSLEVARTEPAESTLLLEGYIVAAAHDALLRCVPVDADFSVDDLFDDGAVAADAAPLLAHLLQLLAAHGVATELPEGRWRLHGTTDLPRPSAIWRTVLAEAPQLPAPLALAATMAESLPGYIAGRREPVDNAANSMVEQFTFASPASIRATDALCHAVTRLAADWPEDKPLRILEIGAGSGAIARRILEALARSQGTLRYVATDPDGDTVNRLSRRLQTFPHASAVIWDARNGQAPEGTQRFDVIVSAFALTRQQLGGREIALLRHQLAPNGVIITAEPQPNGLWNWIFGQNSTWWSNVDFRLVPSSPLRPIADWRDLLLRCGFSDPASADLCADPWPVGLMAARCAPSADAIRAEPPRPGMTIIVAEHDDPVATLLQQHLVAGGGAAEVIVPPEIGDGNLFCSLLTRSETECPEIVILPPQGVESTDIVAATNTSLIRVVTIAQLIAATRERARLWIVTQDAQQALGISMPRSGAALWGLGRTLANEMPQLNCRLIDCPRGMKPATLASKLSDELLLADSEREIVITPTARRVLRLRRGTSGVELASPGPVRLAIETAGRLDTLQWEALRAHAPGPGEVAITVHVADLNFRDVMWALDLLPEEALRDGHAGPSFGLACAGVVTAVGPGVDEFRTGDRVLAIAPATLASETVTAAHTILHLPDGLDFAAAATLPVAFFTAIYALGDLGRLTTGERVLIHGGAGGVGIAAIQYALHCGAEVIATSGSPAKRAFLRALGAHHVFDSRDLAFVEAVRELTGGDGVDVVLNSLSGDAMEQSMALLRPFGRFLELGKRDFFLGTRIGLRPLRKNISYFAIDVDTLVVERPQEAAATMRKIVELIQIGALHPLPYRCFPRSEVSDAFRLMQSSGHVGKILIDMTDPEQSLLSPRSTSASRFAIRSDRTYLITGGLTGLGLATAHWLARNGARSLALLGRRGATAPMAAEALVRFAASGVDARAFTCDVTERSTVARTLTLIRQEMSPLCGVFHAAMQIDDGLLGNLDAVRVERVLAPKLGGAHNLDELTRQDPIELFILYSSATALFGAPGQGSYVAANAALETVARRRRKEGLRALVVGWGPIGDTGYLARSNETRDALSRRLAANPISADEALDALPELWNSGEVMVAYASVRWDAARRLLPTLTSPTFSDLIGAEGDNSAADLHAKLAAASIDDRKDLLVTVLVEEMARILATSASNLDPHRSVAELGMDSLMAVELRLALERRLGVNLPMLSLSQQTSLAMIAADLARASSAEIEIRPDLAAAAQHHETVNANEIVHAAHRAEMYHQPS